MKFLNLLKTMEPSQLLTGQLFFRLMKSGINISSYKVDDLKEHFEKRDLFAVVGNIAVPKNLLGDEHQYVIAGSNLHTMGGVVIGLDKYNGIDLKMQA